MSTSSNHWLSSAVILTMFVEMPFLFASDSALGTESTTSDAPTESLSGQLDAYRDGSISALLSLRQAGLNAWPVIRPRWDEAGDATRWTLMALEMSTGWGACIPSEVAHPYAVASIANDDQQIRRAAIRYVGQHAIEGARDALLTRLDNELPVLRWDVLDALTNIGGDAVIQKLIALLERTSWAAQGEGMIPPPGPVGYWWPDGRYRIVLMLGQLDAALSAGAMLAVLQEQGEGCAHLGTAIIPCLEQFQHRAAIPELRLILAYDHPSREPIGMRQPYPERDIRRLAARALLSMDDATGVELLTRQLHHGDWGERRFSAGAFARYGGHEYLPLLAAALRDEDWGVRRAAAQGFGRIVGITLHGERRGIPEQDATCWLTWWEENRPKIDEGVFNQQVDGTR